jgi:hypothetical protein
MLYLIIFLIFLVILFKNRHAINQIIALYRNYKKFADPQNKITHIHMIKNISTLFFCSIYQLYNSYYLHHHNNINNIKKIKSSQSPTFNKKYIKISYKYKDKPYFYLLKIPRGTPPLISIKDENDNDIYDIINPYLGPNLNCHGASICPADFGYEKIKITTAFDKLIIFDENQKIEL